MKINYQFLDSNFNVVKKDILALNGKNVYWAALTAFPCLQGNKNAWFHAKYIVNSLTSSRRKEADFTRLTTFLALSKTFGVNQLCYYKSRPWRNFYICYDSNSSLANNAYDFVAYINPASFRRALLDAKNASGVFSCKNVRFASHYDAPLNTLTLIDPEGTKSEISLSGYAEERKAKILGDLMRLNTRALVENGVEYVVADLDENTEIGVSREFAENEDVQFVACDGEIKHFFYRSKRELDI